jgi:hypothetical protein
MTGDPVNRADPLGLWSFTVGFSLYEAVGGGGSITFGTGGVKACAEAGVGVGGGFELGFSSDGKVDPTFTASLVAEASVKAGVAKLSAGYELSQKYGDPCIRGSGKAGLAIAGGLEGSLAFGSSGVEGKVKASPASGAPGSSLPVGGVGLGAKLAGKACAGF